MIMKRKGFDAAQNSQPKQVYKEIGPNWRWASIIHQQYMGRLSCINIHKQALGASYIFVTIKKKKGSSTWNHPLRTF